MAFSKALLLLRSEAYSAVVWSVVCPLGAPASRMTLCGWPVTRGVKLSEVLRDHCALCLMYPEEPRSPPQTLGVRTTTALLLTHMVPGWDQPRSRTGDTTPTSSWAHTDQPSLHPSVRHARETFAHQFSNVPRSEHEEGSENLD